MGGYAHMYMYDIVTFQLTLLPFSAWLCTYVHVLHCDFPAYIAPLHYRGGYTHMFMFDTDFPAYIAQWM